MTLVMGYVTNSLVLKIWVGYKANSLGQTFIIPPREQLLKTIEDYEASIKHLLGGRAAEKILLGSISSWASNDYERVSQLSRELLINNLEYTLKNDIDGYKKWDILKMWYVINPTTEEYPEKDKLIKYTKVLVKDLEIETEKVIEKNKH